jgi:hypothetical protein
MVDAFEMKKLEVILLVEPRTFEILERQIRPARESQCVNHELNVCVPLLAGLRLLIKDMQIPVSELQKIYVSGDDIAVEIE